MTDHPVIAVFDLGKTNSKLFVLTAMGKVVAQARTRPVWNDVGDLRVLDDAALFEWVKLSLRAAVCDHGVNSIMFSGHGCTFALVRGEKLIHPILDYEQEPPTDIAGKIDTLIPKYSETFSPALPLGFNYGRHILWLKERNPDLIHEADAILSYPQFWSWKFSGHKVSEVSYLGCHSHLWAPLADDFSSLVTSQGWREKMPELARAGDWIGKYVVELENGTSAEVAVHNGVHDSNAALYYYRSLGFEDFTLVSTGTWIIIFNSSCPLEVLDSRRDMLANVTVDHQPTATIRFMGGREYDVASGGWNNAISVDALISVIAKGIFVLPSFAPGGPAQNQTGRFTGPSVDGEERAGAALLYVALMTDLSLDLIQSTNAIVVDGGLVKTGLYANLLASLRQDQRIYSSENPEGSAFGAAALVYGQVGSNPFSNDTREALPSVIAGLTDYRDAWRAMVESGDPSGRQVDHKELLV
ncbi:carbohydrate kinase [Phyllobacterium sp. CCNWLW109]|uniref:FGGY-family carbohydrate kinase n=1 Tax=Phyllobacterium sp. CCNWLW109 TaxID=3127479 RepID=UPI003078441F